MGQPQPDRSESLDREHVLGAPAHDLSRRIVDSSPDCIKVLDLEARLLSINREGLCLFQTANVSELLGQCWLDFWKGADREAAARSVQTALAGGIGRFEGFFATHAGQPHWWDVVVSPIPGADGRPEKLLAVSRDITQRRQAEEALRHMEQRFTRFMQHLPGLAWIKDLEGRYQFVNDSAEQAFRRSRGELYGRTDLELFDRETAEQFRANDARALSSPAGAQVIETLTDPTGILRYSIVSKFPILDSQGRPVAVGGMAIDVTDRLRAEQALQEADRRKDEFLATLAHELRNPLAPLGNGLQIMRLAAHDADALSKARGMMERQFAQLVRLVDDLLDLSRITRGKFELRRTRVELAQVIQYAIETSRPLLDSKGHTLSVSVPTESIPLEGDATRLAQVFGNLLNNAAKYTPGGGRIDIVAQRAGNEAVVTVRDNGLGLAADMLEKVFEMFIQVDSSATRSEGGLGIGLNLVQRLVEMHGGRVEARSDGLGLGSEFTVTLPIAADARAAEDRSSSGSAAKPTGRRILVVDDNRDVADALAMLLRFWGYVARTAYDGHAAILLLAEYHPEIVLLDLGMPGIDGYEVCRRMRQQPGGAELMIFALTGWGQDDDRRRSAEAGFDEHLTKPVDHARFEALLRKSSRARPE